MSRALDPDAARSVENVLNHLNRKHADTVLFLARRAAGVSDAVGAEVVSVDRDGVDIAVRQAHGSTTARLEFSAPIDAAPDVRLRLRDLLGRARQAVPDEPLTSLEEEIAAAKRSARHAG
jgi:putative heme iron utilization protein